MRVRHKIDENVHYCTLSFSLIRKKYSGSSRVVCSRGAAPARRASSESSTPDRFAAGFFLGVFLTACYDMVLKDPKSIDQSVPGHTLLTLED